MVSYSDLKLKLVRTFLSLKSNISIEENVKIRLIQKLISNSKKHPYYEGTLGRNEYKPKKATGNRMGFDT